MDREITYLSSLLPVLRETLYRNRLSNCLEYRGKKRGLIEGNPTLYTNIQGKPASILLRRWVWTIHKGPLPRKHYVIMSCGNHKCHFFAHMQVSKSHYRYRKNFAMANIQFPKTKILIIRSFKGLIPAAPLSRWFHVPYLIITKVWNNKIYSEYSLPSTYRIPDNWVRRAEAYCSQSPYYHYLGLKNRMRAEKVIGLSNLSPRTKRFLLLYINGDSFQDIAKQNKKNPSSVRETIIRALVRMYKDAESANRGWFKVLLKGKYRLRDHNLY